MWDESTGRHCEVCDREKKPRKISINITEKSNAETVIDRVRQFIGDTTSRSDRDDKVDVEDPAESTDVPRSHEETFYICPHLPCDGREETIREMERWRMENSINREFSEEKLDEIVAEKVEQEKSDHDIITEAVDEAHEELLNDSSESANKDNADRTDG